MFYDATVGASAAHDLNMYIRIITINNFFKSMVSLKDAKKISKWIWIQINYNTSS